MRASTDLLDLAKEMPSNGLSEKHLCVFIVDLIPAHHLLAAEL